MRQTIDVSPARGVENLGRDVIEMVAVTRR
jgi:hypothetical protein